MKKQTFLIAAFLVLTSTVYAEEQQRKEVPPIGIIFNIGNVLEGVESYQGGIGVKYWDGDRSWRFLLDLLYNHEASLFSSSLGVAREYHIYPSRLSPYYGWSVHTGCIYKEDEAYDRTEIVLPFNASAIFGIEWFLNDYISLFAEYALGMEYSFTSVKSSVLGNEQNSSFIINTGLGNQQKIGLTIYFNERKDFKNISDS